jgi:XRE family transcriptional regulator, regulator of sulfur utilization
VEDRLKNRNAPRIEELSVQLGAKVARLRISREWTQEDVARAGDMRQGYVSRIEAGTTEPCLGVLDSLAKAFKITIAELLKGIG